MQALITDNVHPRLTEGLQQMGYAVTYRPDITFAEVLEIIEPYSGLIINSKIFCGPELLARAPRLRWVGRLGSGMEVIDQAACDARGVKYFNSAEGNSNAVAEHALGLLLDLMNNITKSNNEVKTGKWIREPNRGEELSGKTIGIIAFGHTGEAFARILRGFDVRILAYDKYKKGFGNDLVKESTMETIRAEADILSLHLPLTDETKYMIDGALLNKFSKPIYLINTSRGTVLKTTDLIAALHSGHVKAAALDVLENERLSQLNKSEKEWFDALVQDQRVILTPHIAGWTIESKRKIAEVVLDKVKLLS